VGALGIEVPQLDAEIAAFLSGAGQRGSCNNQSYQRKTHREQAPHHPASRLGAC
jgi:hypothetical protein